jgi:tartrate-resistant acid phosphatase type 5
LLGLLALAALGANACDARRRPAPAAAAEPRRLASPSARDDSPSADTAANAGNAGTAGSAGTASAPSPTAKGDATARPPAHFASDMMGPARPGRVRLAVMGDYGWAGPQEQQVAELVHSLHPDFVLTTGDNNYPLGGADTIDQNIGQYFSDLIYPYHGSYGSGAATNKLYPVLGNHDWYTDNAAAYLAYFTLPGNERYYDVVLGDVHFFALDSDEHEPDGVSATSVQALWLKQALAASKSAYNVVAMHHPPYSSGPHGNTSYMQWPYAEWGADLVVAGHDHCYERFNLDGITYIVSGLGGASLYSFAEPAEGSVARYAEQFGTTMLEASSEEMRSFFYDIDGKLIDTATFRPHVAKPAP